MSFRSSKLDVQAAPSSAFIASCLLKMKFRTLQPGERILQLGSRENSLFLILNGKLNVMVENSHCALLSLSAGDVVGEQGFLLGGVCSVTVQAVQFTEVLELTRACFEAAVTRLLRDSSSTAATAVRDGSSSDRAGRVDSSASNGAAVPLSAQQSSRRRRLSIVVDPGSLSKRIADLTNGKSVVGLWSEDPVNRWVFCANGGQALEACVSAAEDFHKKYSKVKSNIALTTQNKKLKDMMEEVSIGKLYSNFLF
jgi:CRP-like cAMP-binding protein